MSFVSLGFAAPPPVITVQPTNQTVPLLGTASFSVQATSGTTKSYQWLKDGVNISGATNISYTKASVQATNAGVYSVKVSNTSGTTWSSNATLTILLPPTITDQPASQTLSLGQVATFSVGVSGTDPFSYQWTFNGTTLVGETAATLVLTNVQTSNAGSYAVMIVNSAGSATSSNATLTVRYSPAFTTQPQNVVAVKGQTAQLSVTVGGATPLYYTWYFNGASLGTTIGGQNSTLTLTNVDASNAGTYWVKVVNFYNWLSPLFSSNATLTVLCPPMITNQPQSQMVVAGQNVSLSVGTDGTAPFSYQWTFNGTNISGATNASLTVTSFSAAKAGSYAVVVTNVAGSAVSSSALLSLPPPPAITTQPQSQAVTQGANTSFSVAADSTLSLTYQWYRGTTKLGAGSTSSTLSLNGVGTSDAGNYTVVVANTSGSVTSLVATLTVYVPPGVQTQPSSVTVVQGQTAVFSVVANGSAPFSYQWNVNGTNLSDGANVSGATSNILTLANVQAAQEGNVFVVITNNGGSIVSNVKTLTVNVPAIITNQPQSQTVVVGQSASFSVGAVGTGSLGYQWYLNGVSLGTGARSSTLALTGVGTNQAGSYTVLVNNSYGSTTSVVATLTVNVPVTITGQPQSMAILIGQTAAFSVLASGTAPFSYQWTFNGTNLVGATSSTLLLNLAQTNQAGGYAVVVTNVAGSVTSAVAYLNVFASARPATLWLNTQGPTIGTGTSPTNWGSNSVMSFDAPGLSYGSNSTWGTFRNELGFQPAQPVREFYHVNSAIYIGDPGVGYQLLPGDLLVVFNVTTPTTFGTVTGVLRSDVVLYRPGPGRDYANGTYSMLLNSPLNNGSLCNVHAISLVEQDTLIGNTVIPKGTFLVARSPSTDHMNVYTYTPHSVGPGTTTASAGTLLLSGSKLGNTTAKVKGLDLIESPVSIGGKYLAAGQLLLNLDAAVALNPSTQNITVQPADAFILNVNATEQDPVPNTVATVAPFFDGSNVGLDDGVANEIVMSMTLVDWANLVPILMNQPTNQSVLRGGGTAFSVLAKGGTSTLAYQWMLNGTALPGATNASLTLANVQTNQAGNYALIVTNFAGSVTSAVATLTVLVPAGIATQPQSQTVVAGQSASLTVGTSGTAPFGYQWYFNGSTLGLAGNAATLPLSLVATNNAGSYSVVVANNYGSVTSVVATLTVNVPAGIATQPVSQTVTPGSSLNFSVVPSGTAPFGYQWTFNGTNLAGATGSTLALNNVQTNNAGTYAVVVTNVAGLVTSSNATLTVYVPPTITTQPANRTKTQGQNATFSVVAGGTAPLSYQWRFNGINLSGATNASRTISNLQATNAGSYTVVVANIAGSVTSAVATLTVNIPASITTQPLSQSVLAGSNVVFSVAASGTAPFGYQWTCNGTNLAGATSASFALNNVQPTDEGIYAVVVTNVAGSATSSNAALTVNVPVSIVSQPAGQAASVGQTISFTVVPAGTAPFIFQWRLNGTNLAGATAATLVLDSIQSSAAGSYTVLVTNCASAVASASAMLVVTNPVVTLSVANRAAVPAGEAPRPFTFGFAVPVGTTYVILGSDNLLDWTALSTNVAPTEAVEYTDAESVNYRQRFYRVWIQ